MLGNTMYTEIIDTFSDAEKSLVLTAFCGILEYYKCQRYKTEIIVPLNVAMNHTVKSTTNDYTHMTVFTDRHGVSMVRLLSIYNFENDKTTLCTDSDVYDTVINYDKYVALINKCMKWKYLKLNRLDEVRKFLFEFEFYYRKPLGEPMGKNEYEVCIFKHPKKKFVIDELEDDKVKESALLTAIMDTMEQLDMDIPNPVCIYSSISDLMDYLKELKKKVGIENYNPHIVEIDEDYGKILYGLGCNSRLYYSMRRMNRDNILYENYDRDGCNNGVTLITSDDDDDDYTFEDCECCDNEPEACTCKFRVEQLDDDYSSQEYKEWECRLTRPTIFSDEIMDGRDEDLEEIALEKVNPINPHNSWYDYGFGLNDIRKAFFMVLKHVGKSIESYHDAMNETMFHSKDRFDSIEISRLPNNEDDCFSHDMKLEYFTVTPDRKIHCEYRKRASKEQGDVDDLDYHLHEEKYINIVNTVMGWIKFHDDRIDEVKAKYYEISGFPVKIIPRPRRIWYARIDICNDRTTENYDASKDKKEYMWRAIINYEEKLKSMNRHDFSRTERKKVEEELKEQYNDGFLYDYIFTNDERNRLYKRLVELKKKVGEKVDKEYLEEDEDLLLEMKDLIADKKKLKISPYSMDIVGAKSWQYKDIQWYEDSMRGLNGKIIGSCKKVDDVDALIML